MGKAGARRHSSRSTHHIPPHLTCLPPSKHSTDSLRDDDGLTSLNADFLQPIQRGRSPRLAVDVFREILFSNLLHVNLRNGFASHYETQHVKPKASAMQ